MKGVWNLPTRTIDPGLGLVVYDGIVAFVVLIFTFISILKRSKYWPQAWPLHTGMALLSL
jgi:hypothetical protein